MSDPRKNAGFKQLRIEEKTVLLLGAILDELAARNAPSQPAPVAPPPPAPTVTAATSRRKGSTSGV